MKYLAILLCFFLMVTTASSEDLVILNWSEYLDPELVKKFEKTSGIKVKEVYYESDDLRDDILINTEGKGYDIVIVNGPSIEKYRKKGWLEKVATSKMPNINNISSKWRTAFKDAKEYGVPYFWGTTGIAYRKDLLGKEITSWMDFFKPDPKFKGKIGSIKSSRDLIGMALKALGYSANSENFKELKAAEQLLKAQKPYLKNFVYMALDESSALVSGDIVMSMAYSGDALLVAEYNENIEYVVPEEGGNIWVDYMVVTKKSVNKDNAWKFLNFINEPKNAAQLAQFVYYATPNLKAEKFLPEDFINDPVIYPGKQVIEKSEYYRVLSPRVLRKINTIFTSLTR